MTPDARLFRSARLALGAGLMLALAACQGGKKEADGKTAGGEILPRSVTDDMLPYDTVRSQPPLAPKATGSGKGGSAKDAGKDTAGEEAVATEGDASGTPAAPAAAPEPVKPAAE